MAETTKVLGSVVAFEGHPETVLTQLRLLPTSPQILVLPTIQSYLASDSEQNFEACKYIKQVHQAVQVRNGAARSFLEGSTVSNKRLVFTNGGSPTVQTMCVRAIMKHWTKGDDRRAEWIFNQAVKNGVSGLDQPLTEKDVGIIAQEKDGGATHSKRPSIEEIDRSFSSPRIEKSDAEDTVPAAESFEDQSDFGQLETIQEEESHDPITRAMRAADALDRETASLQPSNELDLTTASRSRSSSLPLYSYSENVAEAAPFLGFGAQLKGQVEPTVEEEVSEDVYVPPTPNFAVTHYEQTTENVTYPGFTDIWPPPKPPLGISESYGLSALPTPKILELYTPFSDVFSIRSPENVVFGEASLLDMRRSPSKSSLPRVRSLDRIYPSSPKLRDLCILEESSEESGSDPETPTGQSRPQSCMVVIDEKDPSSSRLNIIQRPRTIIVKPKKSLVITVAPVPIEKKRKPKASYVDRGTDAADLTPVVTEPFEPVLPFTEDLVVYFKDEAPDALLESYVNAFKEGKYPILAQLPESEKNNQTKEDLPATPESQSVHENEGVPEEENVPDEVVTVANTANVDEYDPFAYAQPVKPPARNAKVTSVVKIQRPPTPEKTPTPSVAEKEDQFHVLNVKSTLTAVAVQNSLRLVLNLYFSPETQGYRQFQFFVLPELERMWKPVFQEAEEGASKKSKTQIDQILAIGSQKGIQTDYSAAIVGQLERLGSRPSGLSRSGKLDFR